MKKLILLSVATASLVFAGGNTSLENIDLKNYKVVEGSYSDAYLNAGLTIEGGNQDQTSYNGHIGANTKNLYTTAPYSWSFNGTANGDWSRGPNENDRTVKSYNALGSTKFDRYFFNDDTWFGYGSADLGYRKQSTAKDADDPFFKIGAGVGYGRMYDATPLAKALRVLEDLIKYGIVNENISSDVAMKLAKVIDLEDEYSSKYGSAEYKKYWYQDMEDVLKSNGALTGDSLGAFGSVRISEVLDIEKVSPRFHGWKVRGGFGKILSNWDGESEDTTVDLGFEYGLPIGHKGQLTDNATVSAVLNDSNLEYTAVNQLTYSYEVSDRIDWENNWALTYEAYEKGDDVTTNSLSSGFRYYLANQLTYELTLSAAKTDGTNGQSVETPDWDTRFYTGLTYRLK